MKNDKDLPTLLLKEVLANLQAISSLEYQGSDLNKIHLQYSRLIKFLLNAEMTALLFFDPDDERILIRKVMIVDSSWSLEDSFQVDYQNINEVFNGNVILQFEQHNDLMTRYPALDLLKDQPFLNNIYIPIHGNNRLIGIFQAINCKPYPIEQIRIDLLKMICTSFGSTVTNFLVSRQLKIDNANLEAWRWELMQSRNTLRAMFDSIPTSIYIIDNKYRIIAINFSRALRAQKKPSDLVGKICYEELFGKDQPCQGCRVNETFLSSRNTSRSEREWIDNDEVADWEITTYAILNEEDKPIQVIINEQDVTAEKRLEANLIQSEKLAAVGQLAAGVAHEINNPLSAVIANAQLLKRDLPPNNTDALESVDLIETAGLRASQVVRNLLGFARKEQYEFSMIDMNESILNSLSLVKHEIVTRGAQVETELAHDLPMINASKEHLQSVWINIILNALDSIESEDGKIIITSSMKDDQFVVTISDNGSGIAPDRVSRIFEPFFTTKAPGRGTGLGLSVCHRIIKQHGGYIHVDSLVGKGTKFTITLPDQVTQGLIL